MESSKGRQQLGKKKRMPYKRKHHFLPKLYLRGFLEPDASSMLWVYERGRRYAPGNGRLTSNPYHYSISQAGMEKDHYACQRADGMMDYETFENALEKEEKVADQLLVKIRRFQPLNSKEKLVFTRYIIMMYKRVPRRRKEVHELWPKVLNERGKDWAQSFDEARHILREGGNDVAIPNLDKIKVRMETVLNSHREGMPDDIRLESMLEGMPLTGRAMASMRWQYFQAPIGDFFVTNDNPVFRFESLGLRHPQSEFTFPISSSIAIVGSWYQDGPESFLQVTSEAVREINRRTCRSASSYVYARAAHRQVYDLMQDVGSELSILYGHIVPIIGVPKVPSWVLNV